MKADVREAGSTLAYALDLPADFRAHDILAFHNRDASALAERVEGSTLKKGIAWEGRAACLTMRVEGRRAEIELIVDGPAGVGGSGALKRMMRRMLGLTQQIGAFEETYRAHAQLGPLICRQSGLRVPQSATPFEALTWAVTGQQISVRAALSLRRKLILTAGLAHSGGLACYPDAKRLAGLSEMDLRQAGFSRTKAHTLRVLSGMVLEEQLPLDSWTSDMPDVDDIRERLSRIRGIGPWTINYALLRGFGWLDGSLHGDAGVRRGLQALLGVSEKVTENRAEQWLAAFSPWRALVAAHLWAYSTD